MDDSTNITNPTSTFPNINTTWNLDKMETDDHILHHHHHQMGMGSVWPNSSHPQMHQLPSTSTSTPTNTIVPAAAAPSSSSSSSSSSYSSTTAGFLINDILAGIQLEEEELEPEEELGAMKEMMYQIAAMQPVDIDPATIRKPKRRNVRISDDPQSVAARHRRERISEKIRILQRLVPGGTKLDTASMLDEAIRYVKFLKRQIRLLQYSPHPQPQCTNNNNNNNNINVSINAASTSTAVSGGNLASVAADHWPFAPPSTLHSSTTSSSMDTPARLGFDGSGGFHHEVISD